MSGILEERDHNIDNDAYEDSSQSLAALCITLEFLGAAGSPQSRAGPTYTHQCFPGEYIRGYEPRNLAAARHQQQQLLEATHVLEILVRIAPCARSCQVTMTATRKKRERERRTNPRQQRPRRESQEDKKDDDDEEDDSSSSSSWKSDSESDQDSKDSDDNEQQNLGATTTRHRRMPLEEIRDCLARALPPILEVPQKRWTRPIGRVVQEYDNFRLTICSGLQAADYHARVQNLAMFFIETADPVRVQDDTKGYWKVLYLFHQYTPGAWALAGYITLFHFTNPFLHGGSVIMRICQALVLPPYQGQGHGRRMLHAVHDLAHDDDDDDDVAQVNVEDPAPAFCALRNRVDYERFVAAKPSLWFPTGQATLSDDVAQAAARRAKITVRQVHLVHEMHAWHQLQQQPGNEQPVRLAIKKRLNVELRDELAAERTTAERQAALQRAYERVVRDYQRILQAVHGQDTT
jgi:histone acetyltransferase 1